RARPRRRCPGRGRRQPDRAGPAAHRRVARQAGLGPAAHARDAGIARAGDAAAGRSGFDGRNPAARVRAQRIPLDQAGDPGAGRDLHPSRLLARQASGAGRRVRSGRGVAGRLLLSLSRIEVRSRRAGLPQRSGPHQHGGAAARLPVRHAPAGGRRLERSRMMARPNATQPGVWRRFVDWIDDRYPLTNTWEYHAAKYYAPKNFNFWYYFGSLALLVLVVQVVTGIFLTMHYKPDVDL